MHYTLLDSAMGVSMTSVILYRHVFTPSDPRTRSFKIIKHRTGPVPRESDVVKSNDIASYIRDNERPRLVILGASPIAEPDVAYFSQSYS